MNDLPLKPVNGVGQAKAWWIPSAFGMTILLVEQNFRFASKVADRFYVVDHGKVIDSFDVADLPGRMTMLNEALGV